jgi:4-hydroxy-2-oxoheptanedioate aldolase
LIGPNDLDLALLGDLPRASDTIHHSAVDKVVSAARKYGKMTGIAVVDGETTREAKERFDFVIMTNGLQALQAWYKRE